MHRPRDRLSPKRDKRVNNRFYRYAYFLNSLLVLLLAIYQVQKVMYREHG